MYDESYDSSMNWVYNFLLNETKTPGCENVIYLTTSTLFAYCKFPLETKCCYFPWPYCLIFKNIQIIVNRSFSQTMLYACRFIFISFDPVITGLIMDQFVCCSHQLPNVLSRPAPR